MRVKTGIPGLDELIGGGLPEGSLTLVSGACGTGKTILGVQYLIRGIIDHDEPGVLVSFEQEPGPLSKRMRQFGWNLKTLQGHDSLRLMGGPLDKVMGLGERAGAKPEDLIEEMTEVVEEIGAERFVLDRSSEFSEMFPDELAYRFGLAELGRRLEDRGCTSILTSQVGEGSKAVSGTGIEELVADGVILLHLPSESYTRRRSLEIRKMRDTKHSVTLNFFEITDEGIVVKEEASVGGKNPSSTGSSGSSSSSRISELWAETRMRSWRCDFCGREIDEPLAIKGGGRVSICDVCMRKLEAEGYLERVGEGTIKLRKNLLDLLADYPSL